MLEGEGEDKPWRGTVSYLKLDLLLYCIVQYSIEYWMGSQSSIWFVGFVWGRVEVSGRSFRSNPIPHSYPVLGLGLCQP